MKKLTLFVFVLLAGSTLYAQEGTEIPDLSHGAKILFTEKTYDFGDINQGDKVTHTFHFTNVGNQPLVLSNVLTTCGCTVPSWPKEPIAPENKSEIVVIFNSRGKYGRQNKVITVQSNATNSQERVTITTNVLPPKTTSN